MRSAGSGWGPASPSIERAALRSVTSLRTIWLMHTSPGRSTFLYLTVGTSLPTLDHRVAGFGENLHVSKDRDACLLIQGDFTAPSRRVDTMAPWSTARVTGWGAAPSRESAGGCVARSGSTP